MTTQKGILRGIKTALQRNRVGELLVLNGLVTPQELRDALIEQKETSRPIGRVFVDRKTISYGQLVNTLAKQYALRTCAAALLMFVSITHVGGRKAHAETIVDTPAKIMLASNMATEFARVSAYPALYGTAEKRSTNLRAFTKWTGMFDRFEGDLRDEKRAKIIHKWQEDLEPLKSASIKSMADKVNSFVNKTRYITDSKNWGASDYWATPAEFIQRGGDCEDFAIAKYTALRALGVPEERLRVMIVQDTYKNIPHAVLVAYTESGAYILDNQSETLLSTGGDGRYKPIFSINRQAWWLHSAPEISRTIVASTN